MPRKYGGATQPFKSFANTDRNGPIPNGNIEDGVLQLEWLKADPPDGAKERSQVSHQDAVKPTAGRTLAARATAELRHGAAWPMQRAQNA